MDSPLLDLKNKPELQFIAIKMFQHILLILLAPFPFSTLVVVLATSLASGSPP
jgi:hypothetical protein